MTPDLLLRTVPSRAFHVYSALPARLAAALLPGVVARTDGPALHLTFDDGPHPEGTPALLDALAGASQTATFFLLADAARRHPSLVQRIVAGGHAVGAHGTAHTDYWRHPARAVPEMQAACERLEATTGEAVRYVRPPYGHLTPALWRWTRQTGRTVALWDVMPGDFLSGATPALIARAVARRARPGSLVVLHDNAPAAPGAVRLLLAHSIPSRRLP